MGDLRTYWADAPAVTANPMNNHPNPVFFTALTSQGSQVQSLPRPP